MNEGEGAPPSTRRLPQPPVRSQKRGDRDTRQAVLAMLSLCEAADLSDWPITRCRSAQARTRTAPGLPEPPLSQQLEHPASPGRTRRTHLHASSVVLERGPRERHARFLRSELPAGLSSPQRNSPREGGALWRVARGGAIDPARAIRADDGQVETEAGPTPARAASIAASSGRLCRLNLEASPPPKDHYLSLMPSAGNPNRKLTRS